MFDCGFLVLITSVVAFGAVTDVKFATSEPFSLPAVASVRMRFRVQAASAAVRGWPSLHFNPLWILNVQVSLSADEVHDLARYGPGLPCLSSWFRAG
jgi:hypothetical protein